MKRRPFLLHSAGTTLLLTAPVPAAANRPQTAIAITRVYGDGMRLDAVALAYPQSVSKDRPDSTPYRVIGRHIIAAYPAATADGVPADEGRYVILQLDPQDTDALLVKKQKPTAQQQAKTAGSGPGKAGDIQESAPTLVPAQADIDIGGETITTTAVINKTCDDFTQHSYTDRETGKTVRYNLYTPRHPEAGKRYPLVLFMHDAGVTGSNTKATLYQGNGTIAWAGSAAQAENPCYVLAPQFDEIIADDDSHTSAYLDATLNLIRTLEKEHPIDPARRYATGQSGGGMMSIAMNVKYPDFFAASYLVACQWDPAVVAPLAQSRLWITVSMDDDKAYPGQLAILEVLARYGAKIARGEWDAQWKPGEIAAAFAAMDAEHANINFVAYRKGSVYRTGEETGGSSGHTNTWKYAYDLDPVRAWIFRQRREGN